MNRYFPEVVEQLAAMPTDRVVLDGEMVVVVDGVQEFDLLSQRIHPAASRVEKLARETPAAFVAFDLLAEGRKKLLGLPYDERRGAAGGRRRRAGPAHARHRRPQGGRQVADGRLGGRDRQGGRRRRTSRASARGWSRSSASERPTRRGRLSLRQGGEHGRLADPRAVRRRRSSSTWSGTRPASTPSRSESC